MINIYSELMSAWPASVILAPKLNCHSPAFAQVWDYERISPSSAVGRAVNAIQGALGEYFERRHFFNEINVGSRKTLSEMMPEASSNAFLRALLQTSDTGREQIIQHSFLTVPAFNALTLEKVEIPAVLVALDNISICDDIKFYAYRDTCGCCCHTEMKKAIQGAVEELVERQSLLLYWLTGTANYEIVADNITGMDYIDDLIYSLTSYGTLKIIDVTLPDAPGHAILTLFGSPHKQGTINYSTGLSYAPDFNTALYKSLVELWQSYICMHNFIIGGHQTEDVLDRYQRHFMSCNHYSTFTELYESTQYRCSPVHLTEIKNPKNTPEGLIDFIGTITQQLYIYYARERTSHGFMWYTKALSPDLFLHMDNSVNINMENNIYKPGQGIGEREKIMVPFP